MSGFRVILLFKGGLDGKRRTAFLVCFKQTGGVLCTEKIEELIGGDATAST